MRGWRSFYANGMESLQSFADGQVVTEKRTEMRIPLMAHVEVLWADGTMMPRVAPATLEDRSQSGVSVRMNVRIEIGAHVTVKSGTRQISGIVTNCRREKAEFVIGVKLEELEAGFRK